MAAKGCEVSVEGAKNALKLRRHNYEYAKNCELYTLNGWVLWCGIFISIVFLSPRYSIHVQTHW